VKYGNVVFNLAWKIANLSVFRESFYKICTLCWNFIYIHPIQCGHYWHVSCERY